ncbi:MAG: hypothetical protein JXQ29_04380 [Planctomycetes bacterium]|nr:hypothetical protein [Planctomycetota bacterium]
MKLEIEASAAVRSLARLGVLALDGYRAGPAPPALAERMAARAAEIRALWGGRTAGEIPELAPARRLYRAAGLDPTRTRPSSEALVRRMLRGAALPQINAAVDLCNLCAVTYFLPIGLYDATKLTAPLVARLGRPGEHYAGLGKPRVNLEDRYCLADAAGPFGNPSSDSRRTSVDERTTALLWVIFAPRDYDAGRLRDHLELSGRLAAGFEICRGGGPPCLVATD